MERPVNVLRPAVDNLDTGRPASTASLVKRIVSALVLIPIVLSAVYIGGAAFAAMVAFLAVIMVFEWTRMVERRDFSASFYALALGGALSFFFASARAYDLAFLVCSISGLLAFSAARRYGNGIGFWPALCAFYVIAPSIALIWLRQEAPDAREWTLLLFLVVWAADSGAFFFGKFLGGPKISHALSPSKTWAGIGGGVAGGSLIGAIAASLLLDANLFWFFLIIGGLLGAVSVLGDLAESAIKRYFGLKDISGFIPGHGGALDRLDGMIFATTAMTSVIYLDMMADKLQG